ncbi:hypothetical protein GLOIN_2v1482025 [Rhizophagus irregularis DAOM 181602=DAOM 197198]|nr:hypothetical protein GLOIN_2v1482025 [Rhizophagus irregularis DAOM 181602=DAOM 197198]
MLEQEKPGYIEKHGPQWMHIYEGRIKPLCNDIIKSQRCDKAKDICTTMFDIFGKDWLDCLSNSKEITANTTKQIRLMELCKENDSDTSSNNSSDNERTLRGYGRDDSLRIFLMLWILGFFEDPNTKKLTDVQ